MEQLMAYAYAVMKEGSFTAAARSLYISQPALSASIHKLESHLGVTLFDRSSSPIRLTEAGKAYMEAVVQIQAIQRSLDVRLGELAGLRTGTLTIGSANFISSFILPRLMIAFSTKYPGIVLRVLESNSNDLQDRLLDESIDLLLDYTFPPKLTNEWPLLEESILLAVPGGLAPNAELTRYRVQMSAPQDAAVPPPVDLNLFRDQPFVLLKPGNDMRARSLTLCGNAGFEPRAVVELDQLMTSYNIAKAGMGCAFISDTLARAIGDSDDIRLYRVEGESARRTLYITHKKHRYLSQAAKAFIQIAQELSLPE